jgi:hypothetical protein
MRPLEPTDAFLEPAAGPGENQRASELVAANERWRLLVDNVATVPTQSAPLWLSESEAELGWPAEGATLSGWDKPFDSYSSMSHLLPLEDCPAADAPRGLPICARPFLMEPGHDQRSVRAALEQLLDERISDLWPLARGPHGSVGGCSTGTSRPSSSPPRSIPRTATSTPFPVRTDIASGSMNWGSETLFSQVIGQTVA